VFSLKGSGFRSSKGDRHCFALRGRQKRQSRRQQHFGSCHADSPRDPGWGISISLPREYRCMPNARTRLYCRFLSKPWTTWKKWREELSRTIWAPALRERRWETRGITNGRPGGVCWTHSACMAAAEESDGKIRWYGGLAENRSITLFWLFGIPAIFAGQG